MCCPYKNPNGIFYRIEKNPKIDIKWKKNKNKIPQVAKVISTKKNKTAAITLWFQNIFQTYSNQNSNVHP